MTFREDYIRGLDALNDYAPYFYRIMRFIGIPSANYSIPTAQVSYDPHAKNVLFEINPDLIKDMADEQIGFVIAHEAYHVILRHLFEIVQRDEFPDAQVLVHAHEAIINDTVQGVLGLDGPDIGLTYGSQFGADFSGFSTREAYDWIINDSDDEQNSQDDQNNKNSSSSDSSDTDDSSDSTDTNNAGSTSGTDDNEDDSDTDSQDDTSDESDGNDSHGGSSEDDSDEGTDTADGKSNSDDESDVSDSHDHGQGCGGVHIPEGYENEFMETVTDALKDYVKDAQKNNEDIGDELLNLIESFGEAVDEDITGGYGISNNTGTMFIGQTDDMNLDWKYLISEFNPKILSAGGAKNKTRDVWTSPNRRMMSVYPKVILPKRVAINNSNDNGDDVPTFILALDMSGSIPNYLIAGLANLADTVPSGYVNVLPITWSDTVKEFDTRERKIVSRMGTNINAVWDYSQKVKKDIGKEPYVFVITDGECSFTSYGWYSSGSSWNPKNNKVVQDFWYWGAINKSYISTIKHYMSAQVDANKVYDVNKFLI